MVRKLNPLHIAFLPLVRNTFDVAFAEQMIISAREALIVAGFHLHEPEQPINDVSQVKQIVSMIADSPVDLLIIFQATFADSTMVVELAHSFATPIFLWAVPEPWTGERLRLNSLCGINLAGHALTLRKFHYDYAYAMPDDAIVIEKIRSLAQAGSLRRQLKAARLGVVGEHPVGMDTCHLDEPKLKEIFGVQIQHIELDDVFTRARSISAATIGQTRALLDTRLDNLSALDQTPLNGTLSVFNALKEISPEQKLDGLAVRCWPEFFTEMGCAACGAMSMLSDGLGLASPLPCSCEADINGTVTQLMLQLLADAPAFGTDIVGVDQMQDLIALWHCGLAPLTMADPNVQPRADCILIDGSRSLWIFLSNPGMSLSHASVRPPGNCVLCLAKEKCWPFQNHSAVLRER